MSDLPLRHHGGQALGDSWNLCSWLLQQPGSVVRVSTDFPDRDRSPGEMCLFLKRIECLMASRCRIEYAFEGESTPIPQRGNGALWDPERPHYTPTERRWAPNHKAARRTICYQFDGKSARHSNNCPSDPEVRVLLDRFSDFTLVRLGLPLTLEEIAHQLTLCHVFIGADSGVSHVAHSVGCPMVVWSLTDHAWTRSMHPRDGWCHAQSMAQATVDLSDCVLARAPISRLRLPGQ